MPAKCPAVLLISALVGVACARSTPDERFRRQEEVYRDEVALRYPAGTARGELEDVLANFRLWRIRAPDADVLEAPDRERTGAPDLRPWQEFEPAPGEFARMALRRARTHGRVVDTCWHGPVPRGSFGMGLAEDFVFFNDDDRVIVAFRRFVD